MSWPGKKNTGLGLGIKLVLPFTSLVSLKMKIQKKKSVNIYSKQNKFGIRILIFAKI